MRYSCFYSGSNVCSASRHRVDVREMPPLMEMNVDAITYLIVEWMKNVVLVYLVYSILNNLSILKNSNTNRIFN